MLQILQRSEVADGGGPRHGAAEGALGRGQLPHVRGGGCAGPPDLRGGRLLLPQLAAPLLLLLLWLLVALVLERGRTKAAESLLLLLLWVPDWV